MYGECDGGESGICWVGCTMVRIYARRPFNANKILLGDFVEALSFDVQRMRCNTNSRYFRASLLQGVIVDILGQ